MFMVNNNGNLNNTNVNNTSEAVALKLPVKISFSNVTESHRQHELMTRGNIYLKEILIDW